MNGRIWFIGVGFLLAAFLPGTAARAGDGSIEGGKVDLSVMFGYRESDPDSWRPVFEEASRLLYNATDGQLQLGRIRVLNAGFDRNAADVWILDNTMGAFANVLGLGSVGHIYLSQTHKSTSGGALGQFGIVHEFGHYGFGAYDEYKGVPPGGAARIAEKTILSEPYQFCTTEDDTIACIMDGGTTVPPNNRRTEFCTDAHGALQTRHNQGTEVDGVLYVNAQEALNGESCWQTVARTTGLVPPEQVDTEDPSGLEPVNWQVVPPVDRLVVCVDRSESMFLRPEGISLARDLAKTVIGMLHARTTVDIDGAPITFDGENLAILSFGYEPTTAFPFREILSDATKDSARAVIDELTRLPGPGPDWTDIGGGLQGALGLIADQGVVPACSEAILLLTDSSQNQGTDPHDLIASLRDRGVRVYAVGVGPDAHTGPIEELADSTGGRFYRALSSEDLADIATDVAAELRAIGTVQAIEDSLSGQDEFLPIVLDAFAEEVTFVLNWDAGTLDMSLNSPSGDLIDVQSAGQRDDVEASVEDNLLYLRVIHPESGEWIAHIRPVQYTDPIHYGLDVLNAARSVAVEATTDREIYDPPGPVHLRVDVIAGVPVAGADVTGTVDGPAGGPVSFAVYDDGLAAHADAFANDGVYNTVLTSLTVPGVYTLHIRVVNENGTGPDPSLPFVEDGPGPPASIEPFVRETSTTITVAGGPVLEGSLLFTPRTLNADNPNGRATAVIELDPPHAVGEIDLSTLRLQGSVPPLPGSGSIGDEDEDGIEDLTVKFERAGVIDVLPDGVRAAITLSGSLATGEPFAVRDTIAVIHPRGAGDLTVPGDSLRVGESAALHWSAAAEQPVRYDGFISRDGGSVWEPIFTGLADPEYEWTVTGPPTDEAILLVEARTPEGVVDHPRSGPITIESGASGVDGGGLPTAYLGCSPNPASGRTTLRYALAGKAEVHIGVYDVSGRFVRDLGTGVAAAGPHAIVWNGRDAQGNRVPSGIYLVRFRAGSYQAVGRLLMLR